jgi:uncharacterized protein
VNEKLIFNCTWGREDPERATLPFVAANIAATAGQEAVVHCTVEAVRPGTRGACTKPRGIKEERLAAGVTIIGAATVVEEIVAGAKTVAFA